MISGDIKDRNCPMLPFGEVSTDLRFALLKAMFPRGEVIGDSFMLTADERALCVKTSAQWSLTNSREPVRTGANLLALAEAYFGTTQGAAAVRVLGAVTGVTLTPEQAATIATVIDASASS